MESGDLTPKCHGFVDGRDKTRRQISSARDFFGAKLPASFFVRVAGLRQSGLGPTPANPKSGKQVNKGNNERDGTLGAFAFYLTVPYLTDRMEYVQYSKAKENGVPACLHACLFLALPASRV